MENLTGKTAVVTGAASGIGRALALRFAAEGMKVALADIEKGPLLETLAEIRAADGEAIAVETDVSSAAAVERLAAETVDAFGGVHVVCNNAGVERGGKFEEIPLPAWEWVIGVNLWGVIHGCKTFLPLLREQGEGHIVNTGSNASFAASQPTFAPYVTTKFAVLGLSENLARELKGNGEPIGVSLLAPGPVKTNILRSERNRPTNVSKTVADPTRAKVVGTIDRVMEAAGLEPVDVAEMVLSAILTDRFFVLTHPADAITAVEQQIEWMKGGKTPEPQKLDERLAAAEGS
jgi:NAD(P)-dependent dehydrogenase (short-subunit alcohol dehydrogenase family)